MSARHVVVIGGPGYLGSRLIPRGIERGHTVTTLVRSGACAITARRPGLVTIDDMLTALVRSTEHAPESIRVNEVPEISRLGGIS